MTNVNSEACNGKNKKRILSLFIYGVALLGSLVFVFWVSEMAFWNSSIELNEQYIAIRSEEVAERIQTSIKYGKTLSNYYGLEDELKDISEINPDNISACVSIPGGEIVNGTFPAEENTRIQMLTSLYDNLNKKNVEMEDNPDKSIASKNITVGAYNAILYKIVDAGGNKAGMMIVTYNRKNIVKYSLDKNKLIPFGAVYFAGILALALYVFRKRNNSGKTPEKLVRNIPIFIIMLSMLVFVAFLFSGFRKGYVGLSENTALKTQEFLQATVDDLLEKGLPENELYRLDSYFESIVSQNEAISEISIDQNGKVLTVTSQEYLRSNTLFLAATFGAIFAVCIMIMYELTVFITSLTEGSASAEEESKVRTQDTLPVSIRSIIRVLSFVLYTAIYTSMPYAAVIMRQQGQTVFGLNTAISASIPLTVELVVVLITTMIIQRVYSNEKPFKLFLIAVVILITSNIACMKVDSPYLLIMLRAFCGVGFAYLKYFFNSLIAVGSKDVKEIEQNFANMNAGLLGGITIGSSLGSILAGTFGYWVNYLFTGIVIFACALPCYIVLRKRFDFVAMFPNKADGSNGVSILSVFKNRKLRRAILLTDIPLNIGLMYVVAFLPVYMRVIGKPAIATSYAYLINGLCGVYVGVFLIGLFKKLSGEKSVIISIIIGAVGILFLLLGGKVWVVIVSAAIMGIFDGYGTPSMTGYFAYLSTNENFDKKGAITIYGSIGSAVQILCPVLYGLLAQPDGNLLPLMIFGIVFILFGVFFAVEVRYAKK